MSWYLLRRHLNADYKLSYVRDLKFDQPIEEGSVPCTVLAIEERIVDIEHLNALFAHLYHTM